MKLRIKCFAMVRDEADIVRDWIRYHLDIFGVGNVHVLDSGSKDGTREILREYESWVHVEDFKPTRDYRFYKTEGMVSSMTSQINVCDLLVPIDGDEFLGLEDTCDPRAVRRELDKLDVKAHGQFKTKFSLDAMNTREEYEDPLVEKSGFRKLIYKLDGKDMRKAFFTAKTFQWVDAGNHDGTTSNPSIGQTPLIIYHHPWRGISQAERKVRNGAASLNYWKDGNDGGRHWKKGYEMLLDGKFSEFYQQKACLNAEVTSDALPRRILRMREDWKKRNDRPAKKFSFWRRG